MKKIHSLFFLFFLIFLSCDKSQRINYADELYKQGESLYYKNNYTVAFVKFYKAYQEYIADKNNADAAKCLIFLSIIQTEKGDFLGSNESAKKSAELSRNNGDILVSIYNQFAINNNSLRNYNEAISSYNKALSFSKNEYWNLSVKNNIGISYLKIKKYNEAKIIFEDISKNPLIKDSANFKNRVLDNLFFSKSFLDKNYNAENDLKQILFKREKLKDLSGVNASLSHLADFFKSRNRTKSLYYAKAMYENSKKTGSSDDQLEALRKMINSEESENIKPLFNQYQNLNDNIQNEVNNSKSQFTSVIYDAEQNKINALNSENKVQRQYFILAFLALIIIVISVWFRKRQVRLKQENELKIKNNQLNISKKVHDVVANGIYQVMTKIENQKEFDKEQALDELEFVYEKSRDISYEKPDSKDEEFKDKISKLIASFKNDHLNTFIVGNEKEIWKDVTPTTQTEIYQIIREIMVNMKKHSQANRVVFKFERTDQIVNIQYSDNGIGISEDVIFKNGHRNMDSRIKNANGKITFDTKTEKGLKINISFPVS